MDRRGALQGAGMWDDELEVKARYEQALEQPGFILAQEEVVPWAGTRAR